jgi:hypothetical protein
VKILIMIFRLYRLILTFTQSTEILKFTDFNYYYGRMGAGKSSIARLIDFCLGGGLELTPALQSEFVSATLFLSIGQTNLQIVRDIGANQVRVLVNSENQFEAVLPVKAANGEVISGTKIEVLSDLFFFLQGINPPKVRRSKYRDDSEIARLSFRDLFWYCYLDQDDLDSNFFNLDPEANSFKRNKSRDVILFILGFHQEKVTELEIQLEEIRLERTNNVEGARVLKEALEAAGIDDEQVIQRKIESFESEIEQILSSISEIRNQLDLKKDHIVEELRQRGRDIANELQSIETAIQDVDSTIKDNERHQNEITTLKFKFKRVSSAKAVLEGLQFDYCPRCAQNLPERSSEDCSVCGLMDIEVESPDLDYKTIEKDADERTKELKDIIGRQNQQLRNLRMRQSEFQKEKGRIDSELNLAMKNYDPAFFSQLISLEHRKAFLEKSIEDLRKWKVLPQKVKEQEKKADEYLLEEVRIKRELKELRQAADQDLGNLRRLEDLFLDCLVRAKVPGYSSNDKVEIQAPDFIPRVVKIESGGLVSSFSNLGSGGKKTLFKCCFAIALHRLAKSIGAFLPNLIIIDSPMKNISERENLEQFESFHQLLFELASDELKGTQFIVIDKEVFIPEGDYNFEFRARHMTPFETERDPKPDELPLIPYYKGH